MKGKYIKAINGKFNTQQCCVGPDHGAFPLWCTHDPGTGTNKPAAGDGTSTTNDLYGSNNGPNNNESSNDKNSACLLDQEEVSKLSSILMPTLQPEVFLLQGVHCYYE
jgi:hypothetical protein